MAYSPSDRIYRNKFTQSRRSLAVIDKSPPSCCGLSCSRRDSAYTLHCLFVTSWVLTGGRKCRLVGIGASNSGSLSLLDWFNYRRPNHWADEASASVQSNAGWSVLHHGSMTL